ncbi:hypothetical protein [Polynucleobacter sp.]|uniref:hypothetical protein n=1 Tax=Polynucleobacter sp. TaxID=2029855 RepID=UPI003F69E999
MTEALILTWVVIIYLLISNALIKGHLQALSLMSHTEMVLATILLLRHENIIGEKYKKELIDRLHACRNSKQVDNIRKELQQYINIK